MFQSPNRTLTDGEVDNIMKRIIKNFRVDDPEPLPLFYYETSTSLKIYYAKGHILCAEVQKSSIKVADFKLEFLPHALELVEDYSYSSKVTLAIKQE